MKNKKEFTYGINLDYEYYTYQFVGYNLETQEKWNMRYYQMKNHEHLQCNTYTEWKKHILDVIEANNYSLDDMKHFLSREGRDAIIILDGIKGILVPVYVLFGTYLMSNGYSKFIYALSVFLIVLIVSSITLGEYGRKVAFYNDFIEIVDDVQKKS